MKKAGANMKKIIAILFVLMTFLSAKMYWFGYYETQVNYMKFPNNDYGNIYNKLRLDYEANPSDNFRIGGNLIYKHYNGKTDFNYSNFLPEKYISQLDGQNSQSVSANVGNTPYQLKDTLFIDNLYLEFQHDLFNLTFGKQQLPIGVGYAWNPTDIFNKKDILDPTYEKRGVNAFKLNVPLSNRTNFNSIFKPEDQWGNIVQYYKLSSWLGRFDLSLIYSRDEWTQNNSASTIQREIAGFNGEGEFLGLGVRAEIAANRFDYDNQNIKFNYVTGLDYTFKNSMYVLAEYHHNDLGSKPKNTDILDYYRYFTTGRKSLNKNYLFGLVMYPLTDLVDVSIYSIANLDDKSIVANPKIVYSVYQNVDLTLIANIFHGNNDYDEFGYQKIGGLLRLRAYF